MSKRAAIRWAACLVGVWALAGCQPPAGPAPGSKAAGPVSGLLDLSLPSLRETGEMVDFSKWRGQVLLLDFWATWSPVCRADLPALDALYQDLKDRGMVVVGLTMDRGTPADIQEAVRALPFSYPAVLADNRALELVGGIRPIPTRVLLGRDGKVHKQYMGALPMDGIRADVEELLKSVSLAE